MNKKIKVNNCFCGCESLYSFSEHYLQCKECQTLLASPRLPDEVFEVKDDEEDFYGKNYWTTHVKNDYGHPDIYQRARLDLSERSIYWLKTILKYKKPPSRALEVGCGHGGLVYLMKMAGYEATGLELSPWVCNFAHQTFDINMLCGPLEQNSAYIEPLDIVIMMDVLEHLPNPREFLNVVSNVLKDDGILVIQTPCLQDTGKTYDDLVLKNDIFLGQMKESEHLYLFNKVSIRTLLKERGFHHSIFEPALYPHDMFLISSKNEKSLSAVDIKSDDFLSVPTGRLVMALADANDHELQLKAKLDVCENDRAARLELINKQHKIFEENNKDLEKRLEIINELDSAIKDRDRFIKEINEDRENRLRVIKDLNKLIKEKDNLFADLNKRLIESELDRDERLKVINTLDNLYRDCEKERSERLNLLEEQDILLKSNNKEIKILSEKVGHLSSELIDARKENNELLEKLKVKHKVIENYEEHVLIKIFRKLGLMKDPNGEKD